MENTQKVWWVGLVRRGNSGRIPGSEVTWEQQGNTIPPPTSPVTSLPSFSPLATSFLFLLLFPHTLNQLPNLPLTLSHSLSFPANTLVSHTLFLYSPHTLTQLLLLLRFFPSLSSTPFPSLYSAILVYSILRCSHTHHQRPPFFSPFSLSLPSPLPSWFLFHLPMVLSPCSLVFPL